MFRVLDERCKRVITRSLLKMRDLQFFKSNALDLRSRYGIESPSTVSDFDAAVVPGGAVAGGID